MVLKQSVWDIMHGNINTAQLGMNIEPVTYYSTSWMFLDRMKNASWWICYDAGSYDWSSGSTLADSKKDSNGYPLQIPFDPEDGNSLQAVRTLLFRGDAHYPSGEYTLIFDGQGSISLEFDGSGTFTTSGVSHKFQITTPSINGLGLKITASDVNDPIRNIRVLLPDTESIYETQSFHPLFLERLEGFSTLRLMDLGQTNDSPVVTWGDRTTTTNYTQASSRGIAPEYMIELANTLGIDPWFCIPHQADDTYILGLAQLIHSTLNSNSKVYIEYSNEIWNGMFGAFNYCTAQGEALGLSTGFQACMYYQARRSGEIFQIFENVFGVTDRLVKVIAGQAANSDIANTLLGALGSSTINPSGISADALAIAPYFGTWVADWIVSTGVVDTITVDEILAKLEVDIVNSTAVWTAANSTVAETYGVDLIAYEGGQHLAGTGDNESNTTLTAKLLATNRDVRMKTIYTDMLSLWTENGGEMFCAFLNVESFGPYGSWGVLEHQDQDIEDAPKYSALRDLLDT